MPKRPRPRSPKPALPLAICVAALALVLPSSSLAAQVVVKNDQKRDVDADGLTRGQKRALDIVKVAARGTSAELTVAVEMRGDVDRALGRGRLKRAAVGLVLESKSSRKKSIVVATGGRNGHEKDALAFGPRGGLSASAAGKRPKGRFAVIRNERTLLFVVSNYDIGKLKRIHVRTTAGLERSSEAGASGFTSEVLKSLGADLVSLPPPSGFNQCESIESKIHTIELLVRTVDDFLSGGTTPPLTEAQRKDLAADRRTLVDYLEELLDRKRELKCDEPGPAFEVSADILGGDGVRVELTSTEKLVRVTFTYGAHEIGFCDGPAGSSCTPSGNTVIVEGQVEAGTKLYILGDIKPPPEPGEAIQVEVRYADGRVAKQTVTVQN